MSNDNPYIAAGRFNSLPKAECMGIAESLISLIRASKDASYKTDTLLRLAAVRHRLAAET